MVPVLWRGTGGRETRRKGGWRSTGGGEKRGREAGEKGKITQHCAYFAIEKMQRGGEPSNTGRELGLKGTRSGRFKPPCPPPVLNQAQSVVKQNQSGQIRSTLDTPLKTNFEHLLLLTKDTDEPHWPVSCQLVSHALLFNPQGNVFTKIKINKNKQYKGEDCSCLTNFSNYVSTAEILGHDS